MTLSVGTIIKWNHYPHGKDGVIKPYWFVILGRTPILNKPQYYFMFKTTAKINLYLPGAERVNRINKKFECKTFTCFERDCCLDFDFPPFDRHTVEELDGHINTGKVEIKGVLSKILPELYNLAIKGSGAPPKIKELFHDSFNADGITGLKKTQARDKNYFRNKYYRNN